MRRLGKLRRAHLWAGVGIALLLLGDLARFALDLPSAVPESTRRTDAIVVLTGGAERVRTAFVLLADGAADRLFVSGVGREVEVRDLSGADRVPPARLACCVALGRVARDTAGNAIETEIWADRAGVRSLRLVTAAYHMPRALAHFRHALPDREIVAHPVFPPGYEPGAVWRAPRAALLVVVEWGKTRVAQVELAFADWF